MPQTTERDPEATGAVLAAWLGPRLGGAGDVTVRDLEAPPTNGFSSETILFTASWTGAGGAPVEQGLVARVAPTGYTVFLDPDFVGQCRVMQAVAERTAVPMPPVLGIEEDTGLLGAPFTVMRRVAGSVPTDVPPYAAGGWLAEATPAQQERVWWSGIEAMAAVHTTDWEGLGLHFLADRLPGRPGIEQQLAYYRDFHAWALDGRPVPVAKVAFDWLEAHRPEEVGRLSLLWGDSRLANLIYDGFECVAVLDWEMTCLGQPEMDLGWWLYFDRQFTEAIDLPRPAGFPTREATIERYAELLGRELRDVAYYEVFAGLRFSLILARLGNLLKGSDLLPMDSDFETDNLATQLLSTLLDLPSPGG